MVWVDAQDTQSVLIGSSDVGTVLTLTLEDNLYFEQLPICHFDSQLTT